MFKNIRETKWGSDVNEGMIAMVEMAIQDCLEDSIYAWNPLTEYGAKFNYLWLNNQIGGFRLWLVSDDQEDVMIVVDGLRNLKGICYVVDLR
jgi:hypothetical protein